MAIEVGMIMEGKVTGISKFGAFVQLEEGKSGMVHISEISNGFVTDIKDHLTEGQTVKVKVIGIDDKNRINLSIKKAEPQPQPQIPQRREFNTHRTNVQDNTYSKPKQSLSFEEMMSKFKQDSDDKFSDLKQSKENRKANYVKRSQR